MFNLLARFLARPRVTDYLIRRAMKTPYTHLVGKDGSVYMERYWLFNPTQATSDTGKRWNWLPSIRLHWIKRRDLDRHKHDHPWNARTFILRNWYEEERITNYPEIDPYPGLDPVDRFRRNAGDTATLAYGEYHAITAVHPEGVWTLFVMYRYRGTWGFLVDGVKVPWRKYLGIDNG